MQPFRALLRFIRWMAPESAREEWFDRWDANLAAWKALRDSGELVDSGGILSLYLAGVRDAFALRMQTDAAQAVIHGPGFVLSAGVTLLLFMTLFTHAFRGARSFFGPIPVSDPADLVSVQYPTRPSERTALLGRLLPLWRENRSSLAISPAIDLHITSLSPR